MATSGRKEDQSPQFEIGSFPKLLEQYQFSFSGMSEVSGRGYYAHNPNNLGYSVLAAPFYQLKIGLILYASELTAVGVQSRLWSSSTTSTVSSAYYSYFIDNLVHPTAVADYRIGFSLRNPPSQVFSANS